MNAFHNGLTMGIIQLKNSISVFVGTRNNKFHGRERGMSHTYVNENEGQPQFSLNNLHKKTQKTYYKTLLCVICGLKWFARISSA